MKRRKQVRELTENERSLVISVRHCARELDDILQGSRRKMQSDLRLFSELGISTMFRGVDSYADMYEKLNLRSREALNNLLEKSKDAEEIQDTIDAIEETEGYWNTFLSNLDRETIAPSAHENSLHNSASESDNEEKSFQDVHRTFQTEGEFFNASEILLCDLQTFTEVTVHDLVRKHASIMFICQPAYLPDTVIRWRYAEVNKVKVIVPYKFNFYDNYFLMHFAIYPIFSKCYILGI
ncbi:unnamed protein product [Protopolystoma xenopodis]|uniref:Uncharacterized protein n=1 Tax=Protopolystoma xenopodis TaxID=117903 RepID=A0A448WI84_9PLAT|nr:unnamed protein product [Protopolystoma xenopodis]